MPMQPRAVAAVSGMRLAKVLCMMTRKPTPTTILAGAALKLVVLLGLSAWPACQELAQGRSSTASARASAPAKSDAAPSL